LWFFCFQYFVCEQIARLGWRGHYRMTRDYISDLGAVHCGAGSFNACSSLHWVMNGSFVLQGCLISVGALMLSRPYRECPLDRLARAAFFVAGMGVFVVGLVSEDTYFRWHISGAVANFVGGNSGMLLLGCTMIRRKELNSFSELCRGCAALGAGSVGLMATVALGLRGSALWASLNPPVGMVERLAAYPLPLFLTWTGFVLIRHRGAYMRSSPHSSRMQA
jgi:hypothetical membrane protein